MDDSPAKRLYKQTREDEHLYQRDCNSRERANFRGPYEPRTIKYSSILNKETYRTPLEQEVSPIDRAKAMSYR